MIRVFGSDSCQKCLAITNGLTIMGKRYSFVDAFSEDTQDLCDEHDVEDLPHVQLLDGRGRVLWEKSAGVTLADIVEQTKAVEG